MFASMGSSVPCKLPWVHRPIRQRKKRREGRQRKDGPAAAGGGDLMRWNLVSCHGAHMESSMSRLQRCSRPWAVKWAALVCFIKNTHTDTGSQNTGSKEDRRFW